MGMERKIDCRGLQCPQPVMQCRELVQNDAPSEIAVIVDNTAALENVTRFLENNGYETRNVQPAASEWHIHANKSVDAANMRAETAPAAACAYDANGQTVVQRKIVIFLTSSVIGRGDDELGAKLMQSFLGSLPELGPELWRVILLNGAVRLATEPGPALDQLQSLAAKGVGIFVCGTCLMHYGLMEAKKAGETTNMMDIMTSLAVADKIIRP